MSANRNAAYNWNASPFHVGFKDLEMTFVFLVIDFTGLSFASSTLTTQYGSERPFRSFAARLRPAFTA